MEAMEEVLPPLEQQLEDALAPLHGLVMHIVMISIIIQSVALIKEIAVTITILIGIYIVMTVLIV